MHVMANMNIFPFVRNIFVSKMAILKCPSMTSRRDTFGQDIKWTFFRETLDQWLKYNYTVFYVLMTHGVVFSLVFEVIFLMIN